MSCSNSERYKGFACLICMSTRWLTSHADRGAALNKENIFSNLILQKICIWQRQKQYLTASSWSRSLPSIITKIRIMQELAKFMLNFDKVNKKSVWNKKCIATSISIELEKDKYNGTRNHCHYKYINWVRKEKYIYQSKFKKGLLQETFYQQFIWSISSKIRYDKDAVRKGQLKGFR